MFPELDMFSEEMDTSHDYGVGMDMHANILLDLVKSVTRIEIKLDEICDELEDKNRSSSPFPEAQFSELLESHIFPDISNQLDIVGF